MYIATIYEITKHLLYVHKSIMHAKAKGKVLKV